MHRTINKLQFNDLFSIKSIIFARVCCLVWFCFWQALFYVFWRPSNLKFVVSFVLNADVVDREQSMGIVVGFRIGVEVKFVWGGG